MSKSGSKSILAGMAFAGAAFAVDQWSKYATRHFLERRDPTELEIIPGFLSIIHTYNTGVAFGMFKEITTHFLFIPVTLVILILILMIKSSRDGLLSQAGPALMLGGALGNLMDRLRMGKVFDFIDVHAGAAHWPTFNAADSFIVIGTFLFAISIFRGETDD